MKDECPNPRPEGIPAVGVPVSNAPGGFRQGGPSSPHKLDQLERKESELWRLSLLLITLLAAALTFSSWETISALPSRAVRDLAALPASVLVLMILFAVYVWSKKREIAELRGYWKGFERRGEAPPTEQQFERLLEVVSRSQQGYRDLIDALDDVVLTVSLDGKLTAGNRCLSAITGLPFTSLIGHTLDELIVEPSAAYLQKLLPRFLEKRQWTGVVRVVFRDRGAVSPENDPEAREAGRRVNYLDCVVRAIVKDGEVTGASCLARDVTQQRESEARFTGLFETLQEGIYFTTPEGRFLDMNPALIRMLGYSGKEELLEVNARDLYVRPLERDAILADLHRSGNIRNREISLRRKDGSTLVCLDTSSVIHTADGRVSRYQGTLVDITEQRLMQRKLHEEQEFARRLIDSFPDLIVVVDPEERYRYVSPRITALLGYTPDELLGRKIGERSDPNDSPVMVALVREVLRGERVFGSIEYRTKHKDGSWRVFRASMSPLHDAQGEITGLIASSRDYTEFKRLEQQVIQSEKLAAMGQLIAGVAHELNNPLTAILGISDLLRERATDASGKRQLELVNEQARRAAEIVQNLLAFSRPAAPQKAYLNLSDLLQRTLQLHEYSLRVNNINVDFLPQKGLPVVVGDPNQLMQVFLNLIVNAEQAIREVRDRGTLRVRMGVTDPLSESACGPLMSGSPALQGVQGARRVWVAVQDDGPGIPADVLPHIFDPFFTTKRPGRGTGLGLSICMALVKEHGGNIDAQAAAGGGTVFTVSFPVDKETPKPPVSAVYPEEAGRRAGGAGASEASRPNGTGSASTGTPAANTTWPAKEWMGAAGKLGSSLEGRTILVVDDEPSIRELVAVGLGAHGVRVESVGSGEEALERVAGASPATGGACAYDFILCDVKMPGLNGDQVFERLNAQPGTQEMARRFVFMTGDLVDDVTLAFVKHSGARLVQKPFRIVDLMVVLGELLEQSRSS